MLASSSVFWIRWGVAGLLAAQLLARTQQRTKFLDRLFRNEARLDQPAGQQIGDPCRIVHVGLAAGHVLDVRRIGNDSSNAQSLSIPEGLQRPRSPPSPHACTATPSTSPATSQRPAVEVSTVQHVALTLRADIIATGKDHGLVTISRTATISRFPPFRQPPLKHAASACPGFCPSYCFQAYVAEKTDRKDARGIRTVLYEAANVILTRTRKGSSLKKWAMGVAKRAGMRKAKVALARKLAVVMHRMLADGTPFVAQKGVAA